MSNIRRDINNTRWKRHGHWPVMKFKRVSTFKPSSCSTVGMLACFWRHQFNRVILMIRTSWRGKRLWNLSIVRIRDYPPAYWFFAWTHIFFPRDLLVQVRKNIYVAKEKKKEKKKEQFSQHVSQEGTNCNLKIQHLFSSLSDCYNLSIILSVFKLQEKDTRKEKKEILVTCSWIRGWIARIAETLWNETKWWVSDSRDYLGRWWRRRAVRTKERENGGRNGSSWSLAFARPPRKIHFSLCSATLFLAQFLSNTKEASSASLESLNRRIQFNNSFLFTYINAIDTVLQFSRVESSAGSTADNVKHRRLDFSITFHPLFLSPPRSRS